MFFMNINSKDLWYTIEHYYQGIIYVHTMSSSFYFSNADSYRLLLRAAATREAFAETKISRFCIFMAVGSKYVTGVTNIYIWKRFLPCVRVIPRKKKEAFQ